eukprot:scaffold1421_cov156-Alexandrium_tamarense.AAC.1
MQTFRIHLLIDTIVQKNLRIGAATQPTYSPKQMGTSKVAVRLLPFDTQACSASTAATNTDSTQVTALVASPPCQYKTIWKPAVLLRAPHL